MNELNKVEGSIPIHQEYTSFYCCAEWHLSKLSFVCAMIYAFALRLSRKSGKYTVSAGSVARFFNISLRTAQRGYRELRESGFFELLESGKALFEPSTYRVLTHDEWAGKHPGECVERIAYPWSGEGDNLGRRLWVASGCQVRFQQFQVEAFRSTGIVEDEMVSLFERWYEDLKAGQKKKRWRRNVSFHFLTELRRQVEKRAHPTADANTTTNPTPATHGVLRPL